MKPICLILEDLNFSRLSLQLLSSKFNTKFLKEIKVNEYLYVKVIFVRLKKFIDKDFLDKFKNLKYLCSPTTGLNHIDQNYCKRKKIKILSLKNEKKFLTKKITSTSEYTWSLILSAWRKIPFAYNDVIKNQWDRYKYPSFQLKGKIIGIIGFGRVGKKIFQYAKSFGMKILFFDPNVVSHKLKVKNLVDIAKKSDIVVICADYNSSTKNLINKKFLKNIKNNVLIVNTARGEIVSEKEILNSIKDKNILYATDVLAQEQKYKKNIMIKNFLKPLYKKNILITPHIAGTCQDAMELTEEFISKKLFKLC